MRASVLAYGYSSWCAVASYFDGDGTVELQLMKYTLRFKLSWTDNYRQQVEQVKLFLESQGVRTMRIVYAKGAYHLTIGKIESLRLAATRMLESGCAFKKRRELSALIAYYDNKKTGDQVVKEFNECVRSGIRSGWERTSRIPLTYKGGRMLQARLTGQAAGRALRKVDAPLRTKIIEERNQFSLPVEKLASLHRLSKTTISRVLREPTSASRLGRIGDQETLD